MITINKGDMCQKCKKRKAKIVYADSWLELSHGFSKKLCQVCFDNQIRNSAAYKKGVNETIDKTIKKFDKHFMSWFDKWNRKTVTGRSCAEIQEFKTKLRKMKKKIK